MKLKRIIAIDHHRNGICGSPFDVILFEDTGNEGSRKLAILFEPQSCCAVLDVDKLHGGDIAFRSNSWRGDVYEPLLRQAVKEHRQEQADDVQHKIDIQQLLRQRRQVALIWCTDDIKEVRTDLTDDQAWEVLQCCYDKHDCEHGLTWTTIEMVADDLFPEQPSTKKE